MTDRLWYKMMCEIPAEKMLRHQYMFKMLVGRNGVHKHSQTRKPPTPWKVKLESVEAIRKAFKPMGKREHELEMRVADIYLGKVTPQRAKQYHLNFNEWRKTVLRVLATDCEEIKRIGERIAEVLESKGDQNYKQLRHKPYI